ARRRGRGGADQHARIRAVKWRAAVAAVVPVHGVETYRRLRRDWRSRRSVGERARPRPRTGSTTLSLLFLLDTNVVSEAMRPAPRERVVQRINRHESQIAIASIVWHELWYGVRLLPRSHRRENFEKYLNDYVATTLKMLDYNGAAAEWHARERA